MVNIFRSLLFCYFVLQFGYQLCIATIIYRPFIPEFFKNYPKRSTGALRWDGLGQSIWLMYSHELCYYTQLSDGWSMSTCACISVIDNEFIPVEALKQPNKRTKLIGLYEHYYTIGSYGAEPDGEGSIVLTVRHPKCHISGGFIRYNMAVVKSIIYKEPDLQLYPLYTFQADKTYNKTQLPYPLQALTNLVEFAYWNGCVVYKADTKYDIMKGVIPQKVCQLWPKSYVLYVTNEVRKEVLNEGRICAEKTSCDYSVGLPVTCGNLNKGMGFISGKCHNCRNAEIFLFEEWNKPYVNFELIKKKFNNKLIINESKELKDPKLVFYDEPATKSSSNNLGSKSFTAYMMTKLMEIINTISTNYQ